MTQIRGSPPMITVYFLAGALVCFRDIRVFSVATAKECLASIYGYITLQLDIPSLKRLH